MRSRLKRAGLFQRKLGNLRRARSAQLLLPSPSTSGQHSPIMNDVYPELSSVGAELEKAHPNLYERVARRLGSGTMSSEQRLMAALENLGREILRNGDCTWSKVVAIYALAGGLAVDCVRLGKPEYLTIIQKAVTVILEEDLASWIQANGGWVRSYF